MPRFVRFAVFILLALLVAPFTPAREVMAQTNPPVCTITGPVSSANPPCVTTNGAVLGPVGAAFYGPNIYWSARSDDNQGLLGAPIDSQGICRYIDNATNGNSSPRSLIKFVPFKTLPEWVAFIAANNNPAALFYAVPCARSTLPGKGIDTGARSYDAGDSQSNLPVLVDVTAYGWAEVPGRAITIPAATFQTGKSFAHTRNDCNAVGQCVTAAWTETFQAACTAVTDNPSDPTRDGAKWSCAITQHNNPVPPVAT
jgi:hypothetical protein